MNLPQYRLGKLGRTGRDNRVIAVKATTNAFNLSWSPDTVCYHYDAMTPMFPVKEDQLKFSHTIGIEIISRLQVEIAPSDFRPPGAFDGKKNLYSTHRFPFAQGSWDVPWDNAARQHGPPKMIQVKISFVRQVSFQNLHSFLSGKGGLASLNPESDNATVLNMLNVFLQVAPKLKYPHTARAFFADKQKKQLAGLELRGGYFQSVRPTFDRIIVNIDYAVGVIIPRKQLDLLCQDYLQLKGARDLRRLSNDMFNKLSAYLHHVRVNIDLPSHRGKPSRAITALVRNVGRETFNKVDQNITVSAHFRNAYNIIVQPDDLGVRIGHRDIFPLRVCYTTGAQVYKRQLSPDDVRQVMDFFPRNPEMRLQAISRSWELLDYARSPYVEQAGFHVSSQPLEVTGRFLEPPQMEFRGSTPSSPLRIETKGPGVWDMRDKIFPKPVVINQWAVVNFGSETVKQDALRLFVSDLTKVMRQRGISISEPACLISKPPDVVQTVLALARVVADTRATFLLIILQEIAASTYTAVKHFGDVTNGVVTQCVRWIPKKFNYYPFPGVDQYHNNLILKINAKIGGINYVPSSISIDWLRQAPTMIIGADTGHDAPGSFHPSVTSLVSSWEKGFSRYVASMNIQESRKEIIGDLKAMMLRALQVFYQRNERVLPVRLIFYRDGVSEGEFQTVMNEEIRKSIAGALREAYGNDLTKWPSLAFIVVGKRHHIRFFPQQQDADRSGNLPSGFVVDRDIVHPVYHDFYLQSQPGLKGTSRPGHYTVLFNGKWAGPPEELKKYVMTSDQLQGITYLLCYCYARATRAVSIPAPTYYADLVCRRARFHFDSDAKYEAGGDDGEILDLAHFLQHFKKTKDRLQDSMYYL